MAEINAEFDSNFKNGKPEAVLNSDNRKDGTYSREFRPNGSGHGSGRGEGRGKEGGRGRGRDQGRGGRRGNDRGGCEKKGEIGRAEWSRNLVDKRERNDREQAAKRQKIKAEGEGAIFSSFTKEEIKDEERKPKRKVAVLIGYAGSGYKGMQINSKEKTIEGDLFAAFVAAGAISKANADDPKKSSLVRCARTDKGVHAAGNVISLKLIIEDPEIVKMVNDVLPPQIRVWGLERTNGSFSCYQTCDSRWYEYLIPTYSFLPPDPLSYLGKKLVESAEKEGEYESYCTRQEDAASFWEDAKNTYVNPILDRLDPVTRAVVMETIHSPKDDLNVRKSRESLSEGDLMPATNTLESLRGGTIGACTPLTGDKTQDSAHLPEGLSTMSNPFDTATENIEQPQPSEDAPNSLHSLLEAAIKEIKAAYITAKKAYRISPVRRQMVQEALSEYVGTRNFHNYTVQKTFQDPSAKRVIRSFKVGYPIIINDTEWLSLKVHGQSFMMHQIRKMVGMAALIVRCGCAVARIKESYGPDNISIPKAPGLGLLLERPVFSSYNERASREYGREKIDFDKYEKEIGEFKQREIYERIFREEGRDNIFHTFFHHIDNFHSDYFLWVTTTGIPAAARSLVKGELASKDKHKIDIDIDSEDESDAGGEEG